MTRSTMTRCFLYISVLYTLLWGNSTLLAATDLPAIRVKGVINVLIPRHWGETLLPRQGFPLDEEQRLVEKFAKLHQLKINWVNVTNRESFFHILNRGNVDIVTANLTVTPERKKMVDFSVPITMATQQLVTRADDHSIDELSDLRGRTVVVRESSSFNNTLQMLLETVPELKIQFAAENLSTEEIINEVADGNFDLTIADDNLTTSLLTYRNDIKPSLSLSKELPIAWGIRKNSPLLKNALDQFLRDEKLGRKRSKRYLGDLDAIQEKNVIRVITRNSPASYYLWKGELSGFEYELAKMLAEDLDVRLEVIVPPAGEDLIHWLKAGRGDFIAAAMTITEEREKKGIQFSRPYHYVSETVVSRVDDKKISSLSGLKNRTFAVRKHSSYRSTLERLLNKGIAFKLHAMSEDMDTESLIADVAAGKYDLTVADSHILDIELTWRDDVKALINIADNIPHGWAVRQQDQQLLKAINQFFEKRYRGLYYNMAYNKYFNNNGRMRSHAQFRAHKTGSISKYDTYIKKYADQYGFDWRIITAQIYQESRFNPKALSHAGAEGLMQLLPRTAKQMGFTDVSNPEFGIHAGIKYMDWLRDRFVDDLPVEDRMWFTLASYNAGLEHVRDARRLAHQLGLNKDRWFGHTEKAIKLLSKKKYYRKARYGYCRGSEPVNYVKEIKQRYSSYKQINIVQGSEIYADTET